MRPEDNLVYFSDHGMSFYIQYCEHNLHLNYSEKTIRNALTELNRAELMLRAQNNIYYVNPLYSFKWSKNFDHRKIINTVQERTGKILLNNIKVLHIPDDKVNSSTNNCE